MGRKASIWFSATRGAGGYFTGYKGTKTLLHSCKVDDAPDGPNYRKAMRAFDALIDRLQEPDPKDDSFGVCIVRWWKHLEEKNASTARVSRGLMTAMKNKLGHIDMSRLTSANVKEYINNHAGWNENTRLGVLRKVKTCLAWNKSEGYCTYDPLATVRPKDEYEYTSRGEECVLPPDLERLLLNHGTTQWRDLLLALSLTGARPGELFKARREHYNRSDKVIILKKHKTRRQSRKKDKRRIIHVADGVDEIICRNLRQGDILFPTSYRKPWTLQKAWGNLQTSLGKRDVQAWLHDHAHEQRRVILYSFRHTFATRAILKGTSVAQLADLMGTSVNEIESTYSHALANIPSMRQAYLQAIGQQPTQ